MAAEILWSVSDGAVKLGRVSVTTDRTQFLDPKRTVFEEKNSEDEIIRRTNPENKQYITKHILPKRFSSRKLVLKDRKRILFSSNLRSNLFKKITDEQKSWLESSFSVQEVKNAVWSCGNNKAPGPDGFTFEFIRKFWAVVGDDCVEAVKFFELNGRINPGSNASFITLVSKVKDPLTLSDYRPINLIGCVTKVISKVLAERLKGVLDTVVDKAQSAFIKGRNGPLMVNEVIKWAKKKKKKLLIFKADFAKAFDSLN
ncbi:LOW QUALITY PROTEIN: hypothetical protein OSB04_020019 [Centaurea solstitialis]|uniref:Reverse transcriptase domain-containing protein n=1 Tax=Centaurea solstitialis TaxID=347529 RepID=A0AA38WGF0_9ASTR|nr:LOW QUALITY PROTEIN: hypothetical protein OSB04_020019 [Centaurea solstitialis]